MKYKCRTRVLFIGPYPPPFAGPEMGLRLFLDSSLKSKFHICFLRTNVRNSNATKGRIDRALVLAFFRFKIGLISKIIRFRPKLIYYPITATQLGWIGRDIWCLAICSLFGVKTVIHLRGSHFRLNFKKFNPFVKWAVRSACRTVSRAIVQAECLKDQFKDLMPNECLEVLYQAIDSSNYDNPNLCDYERGKILFLGHLTEAKGYIDLLRSMEIVIKNYPQAHFYFAGTIFKYERNVFFNQYTGNPLNCENPFEARRHILSSPISQHYHELGVISGDEKLYHLRNCDIFVIPSYSEGFSLAMLEAMSVGKPIVYTPVGAHKEIMRHYINGLEVAPGNVNKLAKNIIILLKDRHLREQIAKNNYHYVRKCFDISIISEELANIFNECIRFTTLVKKG